MKTKPIIVERLLNAPVAKVWKAITDKHEMKKWYFDLEDFKPEVGFTFKFVSGPSGKKQYLHVCEIKQVIEQSKLSYSWSYDGYPGESMVTFELAANDDKTMLRLTHAALETFPSDNPDFAVHNFETGWDHIINISLKEYFQECNPWKKGEDIIITVPNETRVIVEKYLQDESLKKKKKARNK